MVRTALLHAALAAVLVTASLGSLVAWAAPSAAVGQADLVIAVLAIEPAQPIEGEPATLVVWVLNIGVEASGPSDLSIDFDGDVWDPIPVPDLSPDSAHELRLGWSGAVGTHVVRALADAGDDVAEQDEANNEESLTFEVEPAPDLAVLSVTAEPADPVPGEPVTFRAVVANLGLGAAPAFYVQFEIEHDPHDVSNVSGLAPGAVLEVASAPWIAPGDLLPFPDNRTVLVYAGGIVEGNQSNNFGETHVTVDAGLLAVAPDGEARGRIAVSGTGRSTGAVAVSGQGEARGSMLALGGGPATARGIAVSLFGPASAMTAASLAGDARSTCPDRSGSFLGPSPNCLAVSGTGDADGPGAFSVLGDCNGVRCFGAAPGDVETRYAGVSSQGNASGQFVAVSGTGEARAGLLAASGTGNARGGSFAVSGAGDASGGLPVSVLGTCNGKPCAAAAPGDAHGEYLGVGGGDASGRFLAASAGDSAAGSVAVAPQGDATACWGTPCAAVSLTGDASGELAATATGGSRGFLAASAAGPAQGTYAASILGPASGNVAASAAGPAQGALAASVLGPASGGVAAIGGESATSCSSNMLCPAVSALGPSSGRLAASALGDATSSCAPGALPCLAATATGQAQCTFPEEFRALCIAASGTGDARGEVAVSLTGHAEGTRAGISGCDLAGVCL